MLKQDTGEIELKMANQPKRMYDRSTTSIHELNDDVLRETFQHLSDDDLCVVAEVCSTFKRNAQAEFSSRYRNARFNVTSRTRESEIGFLRRLDPMLRNFGPYIKSLGFGLGYDMMYTPRIKCAKMSLELISKYCSESLNEFHFSNIEFSVDSVRKMKSFMSHLEVLELRGCHWGWDTSAWESLSVCTKLHSLIFKLRGAPKKDRITNVTIKHLLQQNSKLKTIIIEDCEYVDSHIIPLIVKYTPQIERFWFNVDSINRDDFLTKNAKQLKHLTVLKSLSLNVGCYPSSISSALCKIAEAHIPIEHLCLRGFILEEEGITAISKMEAIKTLFIDLFWGKRMELPQVLRMINDLSELEYLHIDCLRFRRNELMELVRATPKVRELGDFKVFDEGPSQYFTALYKEILQLVKLREERFRLDIRFTGEFSLPNDLQRANEHLLRFICYANRRELEMV